MPVPPREADGPSLEPHRQALPASEAACERAWAVIGRYHGGATDVAENHDAYLDEAYGAWPSVRCLPEQPDGTE